MIDYSRKPLRWYFIILIDLVTTAAILLSFAYFHHVRLLMGGHGGSEEPVFVITKPETPEKDPPAEDDDGYDYSGDFGDRFGYLFSPDDRVITTDISYQSHDIYVSVGSADTTIRQELNQGSGRYRDTHVVYYVLDVYVRNIENIYTVYNNGERVPFSTLYEDTTLGQAVAAISGDLFFGFDSYKLVTVRNGNVLRTSDYITSDLCVLYWDGNMETVHKEDYNWEEMLQRSPYQIWNFGPALLDEDGKARTDITSSIWGLHPRTAIGMVEPGHYVFVSVSGYRDDNEREANGVGMTLDTLAGLMEELGCKVAYNLDGGASSYSAFLEDTLVIVSNSNGTKRTISDIICIGEIGGNQ